MAEDIFDPTKVDTATTKPPEGSTYLEQLVGEDKKFKSQEDLAKGKIESDRYISELSQQLEESREELKKRTTLEEFITKMDERKIVPPNTPEAPPREEPGQQNDSPFDTEEKLNELLNKRLNDMQKQGVAKNNLDTALSKMDEMWGVDAQLELHKKAKEIGISTADLKKYAEDQPSVFYSLIGATPTQSLKPTQQHMNPSIDTQKLPSGDDNAKNYAYYEKIRKENPDEYRRLSVEMHKEAMGQGEDFYN